MRDAPFWESLSVRVFKTINCKNVWRQNQGERTWLTNLQNRHFQIQLIDLIPLQSNRIESDPIQSDIMKTFQNPIPSITYNLIYLFQTNATPLYSIPWDRISSHTCPQIERNFKSHVKLPNVSFWACREFCKSYVHQSATQFFKRLCASRERNFWKWNVTFPQFADKSIYKKII